MIKFCCYDEFTRSCLGYKSSDIQILGLVCLTILSLTLAYPVHPEGPCRHRGEMNGLVLEEDTALDQLAHTAHGLIHIIAQVKHDMADNVSEMPTENFLPEENYSTTGGNFSTSFVDAVDIFRYFYEESLKLDMYAHAANNFSVYMNRSVIATGLRNVSAELNRLLCQIMLEFRTHGGDPQTLIAPQSLIFSQAFIIPEDRNTIENQTKRALIVLNDGKKLTDYFLSVLHRLNESVTQS
ncbi:hypothetical protein ACF0H5_013827 [Mactra antiquata]